MARQIKQLDELMDGALTERFNREMERVLGNVFDPNTNPKAKRQIQIVIDIADYLSVPVIAEGVETVDQADNLLECGCLEMQGFYFYKPMNVREFERIA